MPEVKVIRFSGNGLATQLDSWKVVSDQQISDLPSVSPEQIEKMKEESDKISQKFQQRLEEESKHKERCQKVDHAESQIILLKEIIKNLRDQLGELEYIVEKQGYDI